VISAVGHETDVSLTDLVADLRAPTPSAAAESAVPSRENALDTLDAMSRSLASSLTGRIRLGNERLARTSDRLHNAVESHVHRGEVRIERAAARLDALSPLKVLKRGFAVPRSEGGRVLRSTGDFQAGENFVLTVADGDVRARVEGIGEANE
jgi:exodeoxyribonuclease VII large subunit